MIKYKKVLNKGFDYSLVRDYVVLEEKLDGANGSFTINNDILEVFSRRLQLDETNTLDGFYEYIHNLEFTKEQKKFLENHILYGEYLIRNGRLKYKEELYNKFYLFDIYNKDTGYLGSIKTKELYYELGFDKLFDTVEQVILERPTYKELESELEKMMVTPHKTTEGLPGEGVVLKLLDADGIPFEKYYKFVAPEFREIQGVKLNKKKKNKNSESIVDYAITKARMEKIIDKSIQDGEISEDDLYIQNFGQVIGIVGSKFTEDVLEEELDTIIKVIKKQIAKKQVGLLREILLDIEKER